MQSNREIHEGLLSKYEGELAGLKTYIKELKDRVAEHGTPPEHFEEDLSEAEHNVKYYEDEIARIRKELGRPGDEDDCRDGRDTVLPRTVREGLGSLLIASVSFIAGAILGSSLKPRKGGRGDDE